MQMIQCPNCGKLTGFKRALGFGTFFMVLLTCGLWLLVIPFYPARCITCGLTRGSAFSHNFATWYRGLSPAAKALVLILPALLFFGLAMFNSFQNSGTQHNTPVTYTGNSSALSNVSNEEPAVAAAPVTYSVSQIDENKNKIQTGTELNVQGVLYTDRWGPTDDCSWLLIRGKSVVQHGEADPRTYCYYSLLLDEKGKGGNDLWPGVSLVCNMSPEELKEATRMYHYGEEVQVHGLYANSLDFQVVPMGMMGAHFGVPVLEHCTVVGPTKNLVRSVSAPAAVAERPIEGSTQNSEADMLYKQKRYSEALPLFDQGCTAGNGEACKGLGLLYANGLGVAQDFSRAAELFSKSCDEGNARGCFNLGVSYKSGKGVKQDYPRAATLFSQSCNGGDAMGCEALGLMYELGIGMAKDAPRAASLYSKACNEGNADGCNHLGKTTEDQASATKDILDKATQIIVTSIEKKIHPSQLDTSFTTPQISSVDKVVGGNKNAAGGNRPTKGISGQVVLVCVIEPDGNCQHWNVLKSVNPTEDQAVIDGLSGVHFLPATEYGHPIAYPFVEKVTLDFAK